MNLESADCYQRCIFLSRCFCVFVFWNRLIANYITFAVGEVLLLILTICSLAAIFPRVSYNKCLYFYTLMFCHVFTTWKYQVAAPSQDMETANNHVRQSDQSQKSADCESFLRLGFLVWTRKHDLSSVTRETAFSSSQTQRNTKQLADSSFP